MKAELGVIWVLDSICFCVYRGKHSMSNGSEAATLDVYCTEMTGANESISTFTAGGAWWARLSQWPQTSRTVGKSLPSSEPYHLFPKLKPNLRDHSDFSWLKTRMNFGARLSGCCSGKCGKKGLRLFSLTWKTYTTHRLLCWFYFLNIASHSNVSWLQLSQPCSPTFCHAGQELHWPHIPSGNQCSPL